MPLLSYKNMKPQLEKGVFVAPGAHVIGRVKLGERTSVWFGASVRGDMDSISIGEETNIQDNATVHVDEGVPTVIGSRVTVGHNAVLHGCTVESNVLIGMGVIILNEAVIGKDSLVAAGSLVAPGTIVPPRSLVMGVPGKIVRTLSEDQLPIKDGTYRRYMELALNYSSENPVEL